MPVAATAEELLEQVELGHDDLAALTRDLDRRLVETVEEIERRYQAGEQLFPVVDFADVQAGAVSQEARQQIADRGCLVVRNTFSRSQAEAWDAELADYLDRNDFERVLFEKYPQMTNASKIWPIYWSRPQIEARQHDNMALVRRFVNGFWRHRSEGIDWLDPDADIGYAYRVRRRRPGVEAAGLDAHCDAPSSLGWTLPENQAVFASLLRGGWEGYDPWDAAHRTSVDPASTVVSSVFRTFQGWTALSEMQPRDGVLRVLPILPAVGCRLVRNLAGEMGVLGEPPRPAPSRDRPDATLSRAMVPIPAIAPGDTVWWHSDLFHSVDPAANDTRWGNVMYIGSAPRCPRNDAYRPSMYPRFVDGVSPIDFPDDRFEVSFEGRATPDDLDRRGRAQFGVD